MAMSDCMSDQLFANSLISSHKTLFVLDRNACFSKSSKQPIEYDVIVRSKTPGIIPAAPITKTLWTCNVECMMEYMRIVYDIYPVRKLIRIVTGNHSLNSWSQKEQNLQHLMIALAHLGPPASRNKTEDEYSVMHGLARAVEVMCEPSEAQTNQAENDEVVNNHGRIICLTSFKSDAHVRMLEECVLDAINQHNKLQAEQPGSKPKKTRLVACNVVRHEFVAMDGFHHFSSPNQQMDIKSNRSSWNSKRREEQQEKRGTAEGSIRKRNKRREKQQKRGAAREVRSSRRVDQEEIRGAATGARSSMRSREARVDREDNTRGAAREELSSERNKEQQEWVRKR